MPKISVIIPVYNRPTSVIEAIESVSSQHHNDLEIIVVDDGSNDDGLTRLAIEKAFDHCNHKGREFRLIAHQTNKGVSAARNTGIQAATGEFIALLDSDDTWLTDKLRKQPITPSRAGSLEGIRHSLRRAKS
ncbi:MAG: glycosyltransferase family 2 protein [Alphaproteobacteria bacterium]|nr:glycosyltransferase family 2 protein [Alphaproteobacteria bacterium]